MSVRKLWFFLLFVAIGSLVGTATPPAVEAENLDLFPAECITKLEDLELENRDDLADVYFPASSDDDCSGGPFPVVALLQGAGVDKMFYMEFGRQLARFGFVVVIPNHFQAFPPGSPSILLPDQNVILDVLAQMEAEDANPGSPLSGIVDTTRMGLAGHSFGGAAGLFAIGESCFPPFPPFCFGPFFPLPEEVQAGAFYGTNTVDPVSGELIDVNTDGIPVALVQGLRDGIAKPAEARATFKILDGPRALIPIGRANHYGICDMNNPPGALPDLVRPTISQSRSVRRVARSIGKFLRGQIGDDGDDDDDDDDDDD